MSTSQKQKIHDACYDIRKHPPWRNFERDIKDLLLKFIFVTEVVWLIIDYYPMPRKRQVQHRHFEQHADAMFTLLPHAEEKWYKEIRRLQYWRNYERDVTDMLLDCIVNAGVVGLIIDYFPMPQEEWRPSRFCIITPRFDYELLSFQDTHIILKKFMPELLVNQPFPANLLQEQYIIELKMAAEFKVTPIELQAVHYAVIFRMSEKYFSVFWSLFKTAYKLVDKRLSQLCLLYLLTARIPVPQGAIANTVTANTYMGMVFFWSVLHTQVKVQDDTKYLTTLLELKFPSPYIVAMLLEEVSDCLQTWENESRFQNAFNVSDPNLTYWITKVSSAEFDVIKCLLKECTHFAEAFELLQLPFPSQEVWVKTINTARRIMKETRQRFQRLCYSVVNCRQK